MSQITKQAKELMHLSNSNFHQIGQIHRRF